MEAFEDLLGGILCTEKEEITTETMLRRKRDEISKQEARSAPQPQADQS